MLETVRSISMADEINKTNLKFKPKKNIEHAIKEICGAIKNKKYTNPLNNDLYFNVKTLLKKKIY